MKFKFNLKVFIWLLLLISIFALNQNIEAQVSSFQSKNFQIQYNNDNVQIFSVAKDSSGIYWLGTANGLYRYDGNGFDHIELMKNEDQAQSLKVYDVNIEGSSLLAATSIGLYELDLENFKSRIIQSGSEKSESVLRILREKNTGIWWVTNDGSVYNLRKNKILNLKITPGNYIEYCSLVSDGEFIWLSASFNGLYSININSLEVKKQDFFNYKKIQKLFALKLGLKNNHFVCTDQGVFTMQFSNGNIEKVKKLNEFGENVYDIILNKQDTFLLKDRKTVFHFFRDKNNRQVRKFDASFENPENIDRMFLFEEMIFLASTEGLWIIKPKENFFDNILSTFDSDTKTYDVPRAIIQDENDIILASYRSIVKYNTATGIKKNINLQELLTREIIREKDTLWMTTEGNGFVQFIIPLNKIIFFKDPLGEGRNSMISLENLDQNRILIGGYHNLFIFNKAEKKLERLELKENNQPIDKVQFRQIGKIQENRFLTATSIGLLMIDSNGQLIRNLFSNIKDEKLKSPNAFWYENKHSIWVGTENGVLHINESGKILHHLNVMNGLSGNLVSSLQADKNRNLWVGTYTGLSVINLSNYHIFNYYKDQGLPSNEFNKSSHLLSDDGDIYMGTVNGFIRFSPEKIVNKKRIVSRLKFSKMEYGNQQKLSVQYFGMNPIETPIQLGKEINYVKLQYFIDPIDPFSSSNYEYKISGIHHDWINVGKTPIIHIDNFRKGKYVLNFRAITGQGSQEIITSTIPLSVTKFFYTEAWFYILLISLIFTFIILYLLGSMKRERKMAETRQDIAQDLHDEIGSYLTALSMNTDLLEIGVGNSKNYFQEIRKLNRRAMNALRQNIWSLGTSSDDCQQFWDHIKSMVSEQFENFDIPFSFDEIEGLSQKKLTLQQKRYLLFAMMECVTNIIKYSDYREVKFQWIMAVGEHQILVVNSFQKDQVKSGTGYGLKNIVNRMNRIGAEAESLSKDGIFTVRLKLKFLS